MLQSSCAIATSGVMTWSLFVAVAVHQIEEFVWPGGFRAWYIGYRPHVERALSTSFLLAFNVALLCAAALSAASFASPSMRILWLAIGSGCAINALWHLQAALRTGRYSPGLVTAMLLTGPLVAYAFAHFVDCGLVSPRNAITAVTCGAAYWILSEGRKLLNRAPHESHAPHLSVLR